MLLLVTDKYVKIHNSDSSRKSILTVLTLFQVLIIPLVIQVILYHLKKFDALIFSCYLKILIAYLVFFGSKFLLQKTIILAFKLGDQLTYYMFEKQTYANYYSILCFPVLLVLVFNTNNVLLLSYAVIITSVLLFLLAITLIISHNRSLFYAAPYYFILYLCTFEIAPYVLACYWVRISC